nr:TolC family protein [Burkholderiales bacterium]
MITPWQGPRAPRDGLRRTHDAHAVRRFPFLASTLATSLVLAGCVGFRPDGGADLARDAAVERLGASLHAAPADASASAARDAEIATLLAQPLSVDDAVQLALLANPRLRRTLHGLQVAEADLVQAARLRNPRFTTTRTSNSEGGFKNETAVTIPVIDALVMPLAIRLERERFESARRSVAQAVVEAGLDARRAWTEAVAARQAVDYAVQVLDSADAATELAKQLEAAGNVPARDRMREAAFRAEAAAGLARARRDAVRARERLVRAVGLDATSAARLALPDRLPDVPDTLPDDDTAIEALALRERFDLQAAKFEVDALARSLGLTRATRFVNVLDLGPATVMEDGSPMKKGYEISLELPLFDWGTARVAKAEGLYRQALAQVAAIAVDARSEVREAAAARREAHAVAVGLRDELVPLRQQIL